MAYSVETYRTQVELQHRADELVAGAAGRREPAVLVVEGGAQVECRKLALARAGAAGVSVLSHGQWVEGLWDLFGDGTRIVDGARRKLMLRPLLEELTGRAPSSGLLAGLAMFVEEAAALIAGGADGSVELAEHERELCALVRRYLAALGEAGFAEPAVAERALASAQVAVGTVVCEAPDARRNHAQVFYERVASGGDVFVLERDAACEGVTYRQAIGPTAGPPDDGGLRRVTNRQTISPAKPLGGGGAMRLAEGSGTCELARLSDALFTGVGGVPAEGAVAAGEAHGAHVEGELLARMLGDVLARGADPGEVAVVFANPADSHPRVQEALARAGVPFECAFSLPLKRTAFGAAFDLLAQWGRDPLGEGTYEALAGFAATPYSGVSGRDARALHMRWRQRAHSTAEQRQADIRDGFVQGNADAKLVRERLAPLAELLDATWEERVRLMYGHVASSARVAGADAGDALADDARAAQVVLDYLALCAQVGCEPPLSEMAELPVPLERALLPEGGRGVQFVSADRLAPGAFAHVVLANLDAAHHPMALPPGPFDALLAKLGAPVPDAQANRERCLLLDAVGAARDGFSFYRVCHNEEGDDVCESALFDELVEAYRSTEEADALPAQLPASLEQAGAVLRLSEEAAFKQAAESRPWDLSTGDLSHAEACQESEVRPWDQSPVDMSHGDDEDAAITSRSEAPPGTIVLPVVRGALADGLTRHLLAQYHEGDAIPFSPTALEDYYRCPYRWFASRRVGYNGMDNAFDQSAQGNLAHDFFNAFYRRLQREGIRRVHPENLDHALALGSEVFDAQVHRGLDKPRTGLFVRTELDRLAVGEVRAQCLGLLERDAHFLPGFEPAYFELELGHGTGGMLEYAGVPVRGKVDRIDVDASGRAVIVDYKLSKLASGYGLEEGRDLPQRIQTDIYAALVQRHLRLLGENIEVVGSVYRSYAGNMLRGVYIAGLDWGPVEKAKPKADALPGEDGYAEYLVRVEDAVAECMERLGAGDIEPRPIASDACEYCKALGFCPKGGA